MRPWLLRSLVATCVVLAVAVLWFGLRPERGAPDAAPSPADSAASAPDVAEPAMPPPKAPPGVDPENLTGTWAHVDLEKVRSALPDNVYWESGIPTDDARVLEQREAERAHWNDEFGKVQSGTATEQEIEAYFDRRHRVSSDYVEFSKYLLEHYGSELPEQDVALLQLAQRMHLARLVELPRKLEEAHERRRQQDAAREAWRESEAEFAGE
jgi:hypothetical protein